MKEPWGIIQAIFATIGGAIGYFLGGFDGFLFALLAFVIIDYITGIMCAVINKKLSSEIGFRGIFKKVIIFALVGVGHILDKNVIGDGAILRTAIVFFYMANEGISIIENASSFGLPVPKKLKDILQQLRENEDKAIENKEE